jgi:ubiquitin carboxyl-terminal hydrolase 7
LKHSDPSQEPLEVLVSKNGIIGDLIAGIAKKLNLDETATNHIRVYEVHGSKIHKELTEDSNVHGVNEFTNLCAEKIPDEELQATEDDRAIYCYHFDKEPSKPHGIPFRFFLKPGERTSEMRERISKRTGIKGKLLQNIKFAIVPRGLYPKARYLEEDDVAIDLVGDAADEMLGLDHVGKSRSLWGRADAMFIR